jgi:hypothetical protein
VVGAVVEWQRTQNHANARTGSVSGGCRQGTGLTYAVHVHERRADIEGRGRDRQIYSPIDMKKRDTKTERHMLDKMQR